MRPVPWRGAESVAKVVTNKNRLELKKAGAGGSFFFPPEAPLRRGGVGRSGRWAKNLDGAL